MVYATHFGKRWVCYVCFPHCFITKGSLSNNQSWVECSKSLKPKIILYVVWVQTLVLRDTQEWPHMLGSVGGCWVGDPYTLLIFNTSKVVQKCYTRWWKDTNPFRYISSPFRLGEVPGGIYSVSHQPTEYASITDDSDDGAWSDYESLFQDYDYQYHNSPDNIYMCNSNCKNRESLILIIVCKCIYIYRQRNKSTTRLAT